MAEVQTIKNVVVIGGSGNMGAPILDGILKSGLFDVTALSREDSTAIFPAGVRVVKTDYSEASLERALRGQDAVVCVIGAGGFQLQIPIIEAAAKVGVKRFMPAEFSVNSYSETTLKTVPVFAPKQEVIDLLKSKEGSGLTWTGLATGPLFDWGLEAGFHPFDLNNHVATIWDDGNTLFSTTNTAALSQAVVGVLKTPAETANKYLYVASATTTQNDILAALEKATQTKWTVKHTTTASQVELGNKLLSGGDFKGALMLVQVSSWGNIPGLDTNYKKNENFVNELLEISEESVEETVERVVKSGKFTGIYQQ